jgi:hypothetical protein
MSVPNLEHVVHSVRNSRTWDFSTKDGLCQYQNAVVCELYANDPNFGQLTKTEGQNHCTDPAGRYCATDVALYKPTGQVIDFIVSAGYGTPPPGNEVCWHVGPEHEYASDSWFAPVAEGGEIVSPPEYGDLSPQLDRIEAMLLEIKLLCNNMNEQIALQGGVINQLYAETEMAGPNVGKGDFLILARRQP